MDFGTSNDFSPRFTLISGNLTYILLKEILALQATIDEAYLNDYIVADNFKVVASASYENTHRN